MLIFVVLMEKDGGIRPCDVLATCAYKVLHSTRQPMAPGKISESQTNTRLFDISIIYFDDFTDWRMISPFMNAVIGN